VGIEVGAGVGVALPQAAMPSTIMAATSNPKIPRTALFMVSPPYSIPPSILTDNVTVCGGYSLYFIF
jgi:hypothetical protein